MILGKRGKTMTSYYWECKDCTKEYGVVAKPAICTCGGRKFDLKQEECYKIKNSLKLPKVTFEVKF